MPHKYKCQDKVRLDRNKTECEYANWIRLAWRVFVEKIMNFILHNSEKITDQLAGYYFIRKASTPRGKSTH
jgi:hypothetical protein